MAMKKAKITLPFLEPIGSMVNGSMYNPRHPTADEQGLRQDFIQGLRSAGLPCVRLPGGNFVSAWSWKDCIGPREQRRTHLDPAWFQFIPNDVGHDEYLGWAEKVGAEALYTINLGTGTLSDAADILEYTNFEGGTYWSDLRIKNGHRAPYKVKTWYLGNEMDGPWQMGSRQKDPRGYGVLAHETSKLMKCIDPSIETVACVSSSPFMGHYPDWDRQVLEQCYEMVDYISLHHYHSAPVGNVAGVLAGYQAFEKYIRTEIALCDYMKTQLRTPHTMMLSFDEYGAMMRPAGEAHYGLNGRMRAKSFLSIDPQRKYILHDPDDWSTRPMRSGPDEIVRTLGTCSVLLTLMRHADRVKIGCATHGLHDLCATDREHVWRSAAYYPFTQMMRCAGGVSLTPVVACEKYSVEGYAIDDMNQYEGFEDVDCIQSAAALTAQEDELHVFVLNADTDEPHAFTLDVRGFEGWQLLDHSVLRAEAPGLRNSYEHPEQLIPRDVPETRCDRGMVETVLAPLSFHVFRFAKA